MPNLSRERMEELESIIDSASLADVVEALAEIAREKAEHIRSTWQDAATAKPWDSAAKRLDAVAFRIGV
jgi:hypothetical protein